MEQKVRYELPFYYQKGWICYLDFTKTERLELAITTGNELSNTQQLLTSKGRKQLYRVDMTDFSRIPNNANNEIVQEKLLLNETVAYASKRN